MSSASIPAPRSGSASTSRSNFFWPILIYLVSAGFLAFYQIQSLEDQLAEVTNAVDHLDSQVKMADYHKQKFFAMARDLLRLAPTHPEAEKLVDQTRIRNLQRIHPEMMSLDLPPGFTNTAPVQAAPPSVPGPSSSATNASPATP